MQEHPDGCVHLQQRGASDELRDVVGDLGVLQLVHRQRCHPRPRGCETSVQVRIWQTCVNTLELAIPLKQGEVA